MIEHKFLERYDVSNTSFKGLSPYLEVEELLDLRKNRFEPGGNDAGAYAQSNKNYELPAHTSF